MFLETLRYNHSLPFHMFEVLELKPVFKGLDNKIGSEQYNREDIHLFYEIAQVLYHVTFLLIKAFMWIPQKLYNSPLFNANF